MLIQQQIWDRLCKTPGAVADGTSTMKTCNHYGLWKEDVQCEPAAASKEELR